MNYKVFTFNFSRTVGPKLLQSVDYLKGPTRFHLSPYTLVCDHFEVLKGQKRVKKGQNRLKLAKTVITSFIYIYRRSILIKTIKKHHKISFETIFTDT